MSILINNFFLSLMLVNLFDILYHNRMTIFERIRLIRKEMGLNQIEFAHRIGLTQTFMSMIELGKTTLTDKNIKLICATFTVNEDWLRNGTGNMFDSASPHEKELLTIFRKLSPDSQDFILEMAQNLLKRQKETK